jgi:hypothetical protein
MTPTKKPTPSEYAVLVVFASGVLIILGVVALIAAVRAPSEKHELAATIMKMGAVSLAIGVIIAVGFWLTRGLRE